MPGPVEQAVSGPRRTCSVCGGRVEWVPHAWLHVTPPADRHIAAVDPDPPSAPSRSVTTLEERVLALQEAGRPFSAILEVAAEVDQLGRRLDDLAGRVGKEGR